MNVKRKQNGSYFYYFGYGVLVKSMLYCQFSVSFFVSVYYSRRDKWKK